LTKHDITVLGLLWRIKKGYIHGNPAAAGMKQGFFYDFSNYGTYEQLTEDGLTQWHPAFLELSNSLDKCAKRYKCFCKRYKPLKKKQEKCSWGSRFLTSLGIRNSSTPKVRSKHKASPQQLST
jgi:putative transposase